MSKKKKERIIYVDDGRTIADMSGVQSGPRLFRESSRPRPRMKEVWKTYWAAVRMMFVPMLVVICGLIAVYLILYVLFRLL